MVRGRAVGSPSRARQAAHARSRANHDRARQPRAAARCTERGGVVEHAMGGRLLPTIRERAPFTGRRRRGKRNPARQQLDNRFASGETFPRLQGALDLGTPLPLSHSSLWLRTAAGISPGPEDEPFANFYFGGFGNNWVDCLNEKRYRAPESFPGTEIGEVGGTNFVKSIVEWNLPPLRFSRAGTPGLYVTWARPALFAGGIITNLDGSSESHRLLDAGGQVDFQFTFLSRLGMTLSFGYATAFESESKRRDEFMVSLKVL